MKVGIVIDDLDRRRGGMSEWCWQFVSGASRRGCDLHVIAQGFGVDPLPLRVARHRIDRTKSRVDFSSAAERVLRTLHLDVVHDMGIGTSFDIFHPHGGSFSAWMGRRLDYYPRWLRALKGPIDALLPRHRDFARHWRQQCDTARRADSTVIALSNLVADDFAHAGGIRPDQITIIPNGVDGKRFSPAHRADHRAVIRQQLGVNDGTLLLLIAAHNFRLKGVPEVLRVTSRLAANGRPVHVAIAGGRRLEHWRLAARRLGLANRASFVGTVADMVPYYAAADVY
ncbi:MAG: glycosyltransferase family 4 protein, partial [Burkholderiales bacterium]